MEAVREVHDVEEIEVPETPTPTQFGRYRLLEPIGQGGMADVSVAVMPGPARFNKLLVIKTIREQIKAGGEQYAKMFLDEARLAARLNHQNVVQTYEVGEQEGAYYIAMEYLEGQPLRQVQRKVGTFQLPIEARLRILVDTAHGLHHAHELTDYSGSPLHVVHRDVSPQNIFLTYDGQVKLLDFGIAKTRDREAVTVFGQVKGKVDYMAPEQVKSDGVDRRADIFALGAIMWELLADKPLSGGGKLSHIERIRNRVTNQESGIRLVMPELDEELSRICDKALAHEKEDRYATALEFAQDLQKYMRDQGLMPTSQQLAQLLRPVFAEERGERRKRIEAALAVVEQDQTIEMSQSLGLSLSTETTLAPPGRLRTASGTQPQNDTAPRQDALAAALSSPTLQRPKRTGWATKIAAAGAVIAAAAWMAAMPSGESELVAQDETPSQPHGRAVQAATPAVEPEPEVEARPGAPKVASTETVKLTVDSATPGTHVTLDGAALPSLPFEAEVSKDNEIHTLVASAPGYDTLTQVVTLDVDRTVTLTLQETEEAEPASPSRRVKHRRHRPSPAPVVVPQPLKPGPTKLAGLEPGQEMHRAAGVKSDIDDEDPYR